MKTSSYILLLAGCIFCLSACQAQAAEPQPVATPGVAAADLDNMQQDLYKAQEDMQRAIEEVNVREKIRMTPGTAIAVPNINIPARGSGYIGTHGHAGSGSILLIPQEAVNAETASQLTEDMRVMSTILNDAVAPNRGQNALGPYGRATGMIIRPGFISFGEQSAPEAMWIEGYGVVFTLSVDFPLVSPDGEDDENAQTDQEQTDAVWQRNLNRIRGVEPPDEREKDDVVYDSQRVEQLQKRLTESLRHAANIRNLGDNHRVVVVVRGIYAGHKPELPAPTSVMTLQTAKRDIDAVADKKLNPQEFAQKVAVIVY